jgi:NAD(P)-dependent dehydrogenase (short-subunit alcohol dehydrogenase family)
MDGGTALTGRVALVTGAASGIGRATATRFAAEGARVCLVDYDDEGGRAVADALDGMFVHGDVGDAAETDAAFARCVDAYGTVDVAFLNAGITTGIADIMELTDDAYRRIMRVNVDGVVFGLGALVPILERSGGDVVITASTSGLQPFEVDPFYGASKAAVIQLTRSLTPWLAKRHIRINAICPHSILTNIVPIDLRMRPDKVFSSPSYIADSVVRIVESGETGRIWVARSESEPAWPIEYVDVLPREAYIGEVTS